MIPDRRSLVQRVAEALHQSIKEGKWQEWLPQERVLASTLGVSRNTLRTALQSLRAQGLVEPIRGQGYRIKKRKNRSKRTHEENQTVMILTPESLDWLRPAISLLIDELRVLLFRAGLQVQMHSGKHYQRADNQDLLEKLVAQNPGACWILIRASESVQRWFSERRICCLVSGSTFAGTSLPSVDLNYRALGTHAAGRLLALGHRRLMLLLEGGIYAGQSLCEEGFYSVLKKNPDASAISHHHGGNIPEMRQMLGRIFNKKHHPTAVLVANSYYYLTLSGTLHQLGLRIPQDVSLICTDSDHFLPFMVPEACHYDFNHETFARKLAHKVDKLLHGETLKQMHVLLYPTFIPGASVAPRARL